MKKSVNVSVGKISVQLALVASTMVFASMQANAQVNDPAKQAADPTYWVVVERTDMRGYSPISQVLLSEDGGQSFEQLKVKDCGRVYLTGDSTVSCDFAGAGRLVKSVGSWNGQKNSELWQVKLYSAILRVSDGVTGSKSISMLGFPE